MGYKTADHILIPLLDGTHTLAQIARIEDGRMLIYVTRTITHPAAQTKPLIDPQIIAGLCIEQSTLPADHWPVIGYEAVPRLASFVDKMLVLIDPVDPVLIEAFANALHGLYPWDGFPDADLFSNMLRTPTALPFKARMSADFLPTDPA